MDERGLNTVQFKFKVWHPNTSQIAVSGQLPDGRPYDQSLGEPLARTGRYAKVAESGFRAAATYQKFKVAERRSPLSGHMHASPYVIVEELGGGTL